MGHQVGGCLGVGAGGLVQAPLQLGGAHAQHRELLADVVVEVLGDSDALGFAHVHQMLAELAQVVARGLQFALLLPQTLELLLFFSGGAFARAQVNQLCQRGEHDEARKQAAGPEVAQPVAAGFGLKVLARFTGHEQQGPGAEAVPGVVALLAVERRGPVAGAGPGQAAGVVQGGGRHERGLAVDLGERQVG